MCAIFAGYLKNHVGRIYQEMLINGALYTVEAILAGIGIMLIVPNTVGILFAVLLLVMAVVSILFVVAPSAIRMVRAFGDWNPHSILGKVTQVFPGEALVECNDGDTVRCQVMEQDKIKTGDTVLYTIFNAEPYAFPPGTLNKKFEDLQDDFRYPTQVELVSVRERLREHYSVKMLVMTLLMVCTLLTISVVQFQADMRLSIGCLLFSVDIMLYSMYPLKNFLCSVKKNRKLEIGDFTVQQVTVRDVQKAKLYVKGQLQTVQVGYIRGVKGACTLPRRYDSTDNYLLVRLMGEYILL